MFLLNQMRQTGIKHWRLVTKYPEARGVTRGGEIPRALIHCKGAEKSQQCHKHFLQYSKLAFKRTDLTIGAPNFDHGGAEFAFCPGRHLNLLRPCLKLSNIFSRFSLFSEKSA